MTEVRKPGTGLDLDVRADGSLIIPSPKRRSNVQDELREEFLDRCADWLTSDERSVVAAAFDAGWVAAGSESRDSSTGSN